MQMVLTAITKLHCLLKTILLLTAYFTLLPELVHPPSFSPLQNLGDSAPVMFLIQKEI